jgi:hypothetical protein
MSRRFRLIVLLALAALALPRPAAAQFGVFGPNKIQYRRFHWQLLRGEHVDLHFYPEEEELARVALAYAEQSYRELESRFRHAVSRRIPLIVYASHSDFEQTNVLPFVPPEGLLGVTEFLKRRVALPFRGNYAEFRHTLRHELVHVFQLSKLAHTYALYPRQRRMQLPLWFSEGLAEFWSAGEDTRDDMILRDLTINGRLPTLGELTWAYGGIVYPLGGELVRFLSERYGEWRLVQLYDDVWKYDGFEELMAAVYGRSLEELTVEWHHDMRRRYYPLVSSQTPLALHARRVAGLALKPAVWTPPGDTTPQVLYLSPRTGYTNVYAVPLTGGRSRTVVKGERDAEFESFHPFDSRLDVNRRGVVVFTSKYLDRDALFFWDLIERRAVGRYQFPEIVSILSPAWSPDGREVVFSGLSVGGYSDLYVLQLDGGRLVRLTSDRYQDLDPSFSPDGSRIVFASDRTAFGPEGALNLFVLDRHSGRTRYLTYGNWRDESPRWDAGSDAITFTSDRRGVYDVYRVDSSGTGRRETAVPGGAFDAVWVPEVGRYVFGAFENLQFNVYSLLPGAADSAGPDSLGQEPVSLAADTVPSSWRWPELDDPRYARSDAARYEQKYSLDFAAGDALLVPGYGAAQGATFLLSDMLGDHLVYLSVVSFQQGNDLADLVSNFNGTVLYLNQSRRLNWGVGLFRIRGLFYEGDFDRVFEETSLGGFAELRYPFSRYSRVEGQFRLEHSDRTDFDVGDGQFSVGFPRRRGLLTSNYLSYVHDNSLWLATGPIDGGRTNLTAGVVTDLKAGRFDRWVLSADLRRYLRTGLRTAVALRGFAYYSGGERPQRISIGGSYALRGYPRFAYVSGNRAIMANVEWRFPITHYLSIGFPFGEWRFPGVQGAFFGDLGRAWSAQSSDRGLLGSYGLGLRMSLGAPFVLRLDLGWRWGQGAQGPYQLPAGYDNRRFADFWFGFNY